MNHGLPPEVSQLAAWSSIISIIENTYFQMVDTF